MTEWIEAEAASVDDAVSVALDELGLKSRKQAEVEVLREPSTGFLGIGRKTALVKVSQKAYRRKRRGKGSSSVKKQDSKAGQSTTAEPAQEVATANQGSRPPAGGSTTKSSSKDPREPSRRPRGRSQKSRDSSDANTKPVQEKNMSDTSNDAKQKEKPQFSVEEQAEVASAFLTGLVAAFGLDATVTTRIDDEAVHLDVDGDAEALVGPRGSIMQAILELTRTVVHRKTYGSPRLRLDVVGYNARRRVALKIYAERLAEGVLADGGETMLEAMSAGDRKVVHDAIGDIDGVRSFSEGEDPNRSVVIAPV